MDLATIQGIVTLFATMSAVVYGGVKVYLLIVEHRRSRSESKTDLGNSHSKEPSRGPSPAAVEVALDSDIKEQVSHELTTLELISQYLQFVAQSTAYIELRGLGPESDSRMNRLQINIKDIFTPLYIRKPLESQFAREDARVPLIQEVVSHPHALVTGEPGSGKSTVVRYVAYTFASYLLEVSKSHIAKSESDVKWELYTGEDGIRTPLLITATQLHSFAVKRQLTRKDQSSSTDDLCMACAIADFTTPDSYSQLYRVLIPVADRGAVVLLLDGLDELPSDEALIAVEDALRLFIRRWPRARIVATSRPGFAPRSGEWSQFKDIVIDGFSEPDIKAFVGRWSDTMLTDAKSQSRAEYAHELLTGITQNQHLIQLATNPAMLTCMASLHYHRRSLPESRAEILEAILQWLIRSRQAAVSGPTIEGARREQAFRRLAYKMSMSDTGRRNTCGIAAAAGILAELFDHNVDDAIRFLEREKVRSGVIVPASKGDVKFWHLWFQEYLTAKAIASQPDDGQGWWASVLPRLDETIWQEIIAFVPSCLFRLGAERVDLFFRRLADSSINSDPSVKARRLALAGRSLRDLQLSGYCAPKTSDWTHFVERTISEVQEEATSISIEERYFAWVAYGICGDARIRNWENTWVTLEVSEVQIGAQCAAHDQPRYDALGTPWERIEHFRLAQFDMRRYLITVAEYEQFVGDDAYSNRSLWTPLAWDWIQRENIRAPVRWIEQLGTPNCPVVGVSFHEARAFAAWAAKSFRNSGWKYRLPHDAEWEYAARRNDDGRFLWGTTIRSGALAETNWRGADLLRRSPVGMFPHSTTWDGIADLVGNVEEWCESDISSTLGRPIGVTLLIRIAGEFSEIVRGGSAIRPMRLCRPSYRSAINREGRYMTVGFRLVREYTH
jgi:formylglycine-generating enzyme required for sulfatase activity